MRKKVEPNTARIIEGLRDTGYSFEAAIADLVDNSIEAGATVVNITVDLDFDRQPLVQVADNGSGMDLPALENAMRYGAAQKPDQNRLGWFGLGLKTASTSFCRRLTVVTRAPAGPTLAATWDLDDVVSANDWVLDIGPADSGEETLFAEHVESSIGVPSEGSGTVVVWRKVDRLLRKPSGQEYVDPDGALRRRIDSLEWHLRMVYQRFLDSSDERAVNVDIRIDGRSLKPWDPFAECFGLKPELKKKILLRSERTGDEAVVLLRAFILPKPHEMGDPKAFKEYVRSHTSDRQGFFFYRENRLIDTPGWIDKWGNETHLRGLRIELSFPATLDPYFGVGLRKTGLQPDKSFIEILDESVSSLRREANRRDRQGSARKAAAESKSRPNPSDRILDEKRGGLEAPEVASNEHVGTTIANNQSEDLVVLGPDGAPNPNFTIEVLTDPDDVFVLLTDELEGAGMWEPALRLNAGRNDLMVRINSDNEWVRRAYSVHPQGSAERMALDFLLYALATAELNNTDEELRKEFGQFRVEVARNLTRLAEELPEPSVDD